MGRVGAGDCGGGAPRPHGPMTSAGPTPDLPRPLSASRCLGRLWPATRREGSRARSLTPPGGLQSCCSYDSDEWVASRLRAARACHLGTSVRACALGWRRSPRELSGCSERRTIDPPSSGMPSRTPGLCTSSSGRLRAAALVILPGGPSRDQRLRSNGNMNGNRSGRRLKACVLAGVLLIAGAISVTVMSTTSVVRR